MVKNLWPFSEVTRVLFDRYFSTDLKCVDVEKEHEMKMLKSMEDYCLKLKIKLLRRK